MLCSRRTSMPCTGYFDLTWSSHWSVTESRFFLLAPERLGWVTKRRLASWRNIQSFYSQLILTLLKTVDHTDLKGYSSWKLCGHQHRATSFLFFLHELCQISVWKKNPTTTWRRSKNPQENCHDSDPDLWWNKVDLEFYPPACATEKAHKAPPKAQVFHEFCSLGTAWRWGRKVTNKLAPGNTMVASYMLEARTPRICNVYLF